MQNTPVCPSCASSEWRELGSRQYSQADIADASPYVQRRLNILLQVWLPGCKTVEITSILCSRCGLIIYRPRPDGKDLDAKYMALKAADKQTSSHSQISRRRAREMLRAINRLSARKICGLSVLDFGGGDGSMMQPFLDAGCECDLIDYASTQSRGIRKVSNTLEGLSSHHRYD